MESKSKESGKNYTVKQGDCIESIAFKNGLFWDTIWNHPNNQKLCSERNNPNALLAGDKVFVPDLRLKEESAATEQRYRFRRKGVPSKLKIILKDEGKPRANLPYILEIDGKLSSGVTDAQGRIQHPIPPNARKGQLLVGPAGKEVYRLQLGNIDPITEISGLQGRLRNLGYYNGPVDCKMDATTEEAIKDFQSKHGLNATGKVDDAMRNGLVSEHGS